MLGSKLNKATYSCATSARPLAICPSILLEQLASKRGYFRRKTHRKAGSRLFTQAQSQLQASARFQPGGVEEEFLLLPCLDLRKSKLLLKWFSVSLLNERKWHSKGCWLEDTRGFGAGTIGEDHMDMVGGQKQRRAMREKVNEGEKKMGETKN